MTFHPSLQPGPTGLEPIRIGALAPLTPPGWTEAGRHLIAGMASAVRRVNAAGGIRGRPLELLIRDTAADPRLAERAVEELAALGVVALIGEFHSVVARAVAGAASTLEIPFLCSSAVLDALVDGPGEGVARLAPPQSKGWRVYADYLIRNGHTRLAVAIQPSLYWATGVEILRQRVSEYGGFVVELAANVPTIEGFCERLVETRATALLLLTGAPEPAVSIVRAIRDDDRLSKIMIGAPAGQPEFAQWRRMLGDLAGGIPFLRYMPANLTLLGAQAAQELVAELNEPSFVAFEGYDSILVTAESLQRYGGERDRIAQGWPALVVEGTRGAISFSLGATSGIWQWETPPIQIVDRDPRRPDRFRILHQQ